MILGVPARALLAGVALMFLVACGGSDPEGRGPASSGKEAPPPSAGDSQASDGDGPGTKPPADSPASAGAKQLGPLLFERVSHDFGRINDLEAVTQAFPFTNTSDEPVTVAAVKTTCGCLRSEVPKGPIAPGATAEVRLTYRPQLRQGKDKKGGKVMIGGRAVGELNVTTDVVPRIGIYPRSLWMGQVKRGEAGEDKKLEVVSRLPDMKPGTPILEDERFQIELVDTRQEERQGDAVTVYEYRLRFAGAEQAGRIRSRLEIPTGLAKRKSVGIAVFASVVGPVWVSPDVVSLGTRRSGDTLESTVRVRHRDGEPLQILKASVVGPEDLVIQATVEPDPRVKGMFLVKLVGKAPKGQERGIRRINATLVIETDLLAQPRVELPLMLYVSQEPPPARGN